MTHPNEELVRSGYDAFAKGDIELLRDEYFAPDIVWHFPGRSPLASDYRGVDDVLAFFGRSFELSGGTLQIEVHDVLANDEHAVALIHVRADRDGKTLDDNSVQVFHINDGKVTESWIHPGDQYAGDEFWS